MQRVSLLGELELGIPDPDTIAVVGEYARAFWAFSMCTLDQSHFDVQWLRSIMRGAARWLMVDG